MLKITAFTTTLFARSPQRCSPGHHNAVRPFTTTLFARSPQRFSPGHNNAVRPVTTTLFARSPQRYSPKVGILLACRKHLHDGIILLIEEVCTPNKLV
jgi:hypothetical protein